MTVVNSPLAKLRVPEKTLDIIAPPSNGPGELRCEPAAPKLLAAVRNVRSVLIGASRNLSRSMMRGMPSGSFAIHAWAGPDGGAKSDNRREHEEDEQKGSERSGHPQPLERAQGWLHQEVEHDGEDQGQDDLTGHVGSGQHRKNNKATEKECLCIGRQGMSANNSSGASISSC